jgi:hypothetical protein
MRTLALSSLLLVSGLSGLAQDSKELLDKAPAPVEQALRARVDQYYQAFVAGKFKQAYLLVADDSQDAFLEADKQQYKACEILRIRYSPDFTKAVVVESCKSEWKWHGIVSPTTFATTSNWEVVDGQWYWHYVKPTQVMSPFSPSGFVPIPSGDTEPKKDAPAATIPSDMKGVAQGILALVSLDKQAVRLSQDQPSRDVVRVRNGMPGMITLKLDDPKIPGLKITVGKMQLQAHEETTVLFEWRPDDPALQCQDCAKNIRNSTIALQVVQTGRVLPITISFEHGPAAGRPVPPQVPPAPQK